MTNANLRKATISYFSPSSGSVQKTERSQSESKGSGTGHKVMESHMEEPGKLVQIAVRVEVEQVDVA